jgi:hypothetical protein
MALLAPGLVAADEDDPTRAVIAFQSESILSHGDIIRSSVATRSKLGLCRQAARRRDRQAVDQDRCHGRCWAAGAGWAANEPVAGLDGGRLAGSGP